ncbi:MAG: peptidoglycan-binding protein [Clostridia bacterium]|nr:peptidoglycan-binding protein [Clostridia bacterium]
MKKAWVVIAITALLLIAAPGALAKSYSNGDTADEVSTIQRALTELNLYYTDITGHFGNKTEKAVKLFQKKYGLRQTGVVDDTTRERLYLAANISSSTVSNSSGTSYSTSTVLRNGQSGQAVRQLQTDLQTLGFYSGTVTGHYGNITQEAVRKFQRKNGLSADGIAGKNTLSKLNELLSGGSSTVVLPSTGTSSGSTASSSTSTAPMGTTLLKQGMSGDAVRVLQQNLVLLEYYEGTVTGTYGRLTKEAVRLFQRDNDLSSDGVAGPKTLAKIEDELAALAKTEENANVTSNPSATITPPAVVTPTSTPAPTTPTVSLANVETLNTEWTLRRTSRSGHVTRLQKALAALGYFKETPTGYFGSATEAAVIAYQTAKGLTADGIAGRATLKSINSDIKNGVTATNSGSID